MTGMLPKDRIRMDDEDEPEVPEPQGPEPRTDPLRRMSPTEQYHFASHVFQP